MSQAAEKHSSVESAIAALTGKNRRSYIGANMCMTCDGEAREFRDELSHREYTISGMCQTCQDSFFNQNKGQRTMEPNEFEDTDPIVDHEPIAPTDDDIQDELDLMGTYL